MDESKHFAVFINPFVNATTYALKGESNVFDVGGVLVKVKQSTQGKQDRFHN